MAHGHVSLDDVRSEVLRMLEDAPDGDPLDERTAALIALSVRATPTVLDPSGMRACALRALELGATPDELHEALLLVSGLGVHTLMEGTRAIADVLGDRGEGLPERDERREQLWERHVGNDPYWDRFEAETPGFLDALLRLSPEGFAAFFEYCAVPWRTGALRARVKELIAVAADATPTHRYLPGLRLHVGNAIALGVGRTAVLQTLDIAAAAPPHRGVGTSRAPGRQH